MGPSEVSRGDIWLVDLGLAAKVRPVVVLSVAYLDHERAVATYIPRTTSLRNTRFEVPHSAPGFQLGAFDAQVLHGRRIRGDGLPPEDCAAASMSSTTLTIRCWRLRES